MSDRINLDAEFDHEPKEQRTPWVDRHIGLVAVGAFLAVASVVVGVPMYVVGVHEKSAAAVIDAAPVFSDEHPRRCGACGCIGRRISYATWPKPHMRVQCGRCRNAWDERLPEGR